MKPISEMTPLEIRRAILVRIFDVDDSKLWTATDNALEVNSDIPIAPPPAYCCALHYESEIGPAFEVVAKMHADTKTGWLCDFDSEYKDGKVVWRVNFARPEQYSCWGKDELGPTFESLALGICHAALTALEAIGSAK